MTRARLRLSGGLALGLALALSSPVQAQEEDDDLAELLDVLAEETEIATKTRMNSDYVPGIVTVLDARTVSAMGVRTVWDALSFVPGVETWRDASGTPTVTVRGITFPFNSGSIAVLVNSVPIAAESAGINGAVLLMPIAQVERLEFVRGPGSVIYGDFAFQGLLNIVTRSEGTGIEATIASHNEQELTVRGSQGGEDWHVSGQYSNLETDEAVVPVDRAAREQRIYANVLLRRGGFSLLGQGVGRDLDRASPTIPSPVFEESSRSLEARYEHRFDSGLEARFRLQDVSNDLVTTNLSFHGGQREAGADLIWGVSARQSWLAGVEYVEASIDSASTRAPPIPGQPTPPPTRLSAREREVRSAYVQGQFGLTDSLQATLGARHDDNEAIGDRVTPRASLVWRAAENHILKAQYAEGFRSPTFFELYASPNQPMLDFEVNRTAEINYVYQRPNTTARATLFKSNIDDMVFRDFARQRFGNVAEARSTGIELDLSHQFAAHLRLDAALAWIDSEHNRNPTLTEGDVTTAADWFGNLGMLWTPFDHTALGLRWTHVGARDSIVAGAGAYDRVDLSMTRRHFLIEDLDLQIGVQNVLDERFVYILPNPASDGPAPYEGRTAFARLSWEWR